MLITTVVAKAITGAISIGGFTTSTIVGFHSSFFKNATTNYMPDLFISQVRSPANCTTTIGCVSSTTLY